VAGRTRAKRVARGQHFLRSPRLAAAIVEAARIAPGDLVVDVGAGGGVLSAELARRGARVVAIEVDPVWAGRLRSSRTSRSGRVRTSCARCSTIPAAGSSAPI
jgi:16S rRNA A1518/A1519 N6-dimethyltransferase RsmA/KsgA/DIM1 with predicted DNA glycosylase/AP lyase activity